MIDPTICNPVIDDVRRVLDAGRGELSEFAIHKALTDHPCFREMPKSRLSLFHRHFLVMNALYVLRQRYWSEGLGLLKVSPLCINLCPQGVDKRRNSGILEFDALSAYYLDWNNYNNATEENVNKLLENFWRRFAAAQEQVQAHVENIDEHTRALHTLRLKANASAIDIKRNYRMLAAQHHPDRGGDAQAFINIRRAYETLRC